MTVFNQLSDAYDSFRPDYPAALFEFLQARLALGRSSRVTDVACGTGRSTVPWCAITHSLTGIEAAANMLFHARRRAAEAGCEVTWVQARAEESGLFSQSQDLVTVAQAFHWLGPQVLDEFARILKPGGAVAIYWNVPAHPDAPYFQDVTALIQAYNPAYDRGHHDFKDTEARLRAHPAFPTVETYAFPHTVRYTIDHYLGYLASRSFAGGVIQGEAWDRFSAELRRCLSSHFPDGRVTEAYDAELYLGVKAPG